MSKQLDFFTIAKALDTGPASQYTALMYIRTDLHRPGWTSDKALVYYNMLIYSDISPLLNELRSSILDSLKGEINV